MSPYDHSSQVAELSAKIKPVPFGMFTTVDQHGHLTSQPMTTQQVDADGGLWFFTSTATDLWENIAANPKVNVSFAEPADRLYVSISGTAERVVERERIRALWNPMVAAWFPNGADDPYVALVRVAARTVHFWDSKENKVTQMFEMAKAAITGTRPEIDPGEHGKLKL
jgi:general stress protein 26